MHTDLTLVRSVALTVFEHESHELNEYFIAHGSHFFNAHGSHRSHGFAYASHGSRMSFFELYYKSKNPIEAISRRLKDP